MMTLELSSSASPDSLDLNLQLSFALSDDDITVRRDLRVVWLPWSLFAPRGEPMPPPPAAVARLIAKLRVLLFASSDGRIRDLCGVVVYRPECTVPALETSEADHPRRAAGVFLLQALWKVSFEEVRTRAQAFSKGSEGAWDWLTNWLAGGHR